MGIPRRGGLRWPNLRRRACVALPLCAALVALLAAAPSAQATFHLMLVREIYPGPAAAPESSYVELQMYASGQELVGGHKAILKNATGATIAEPSFASNLAAGSVSQQTILIGDTGVNAAFGVTPDLTSASFNVPAAGGAVCWGTIDCVSWGSFSGAAIPSAGSPADPGGIPSGLAIRRKIGGGSCSNLLDAGDDTADSATDFTDVPPSPISYSTKPSPPACTPPLQPPMTTIDTKPANPTKVTSASFTYHSTPAGATFECRLDVEPFESCSSSGKSYPGPLGETGHTFQVKATDANGTGPVAGFTWTVDVTPPVATIVDKPPAESTPTASFTYSSSETGSSFECKLDSGAFASCPVTGKTYTGLADGPHTFEVRARDKALNQGSASDPYEWEVDHTLADTTPPQTTIVDKPANPSVSSAASFAYMSNEAGSTFECSLDSAPFGVCATGGILYTGLANGAHTFQVRAKDSSGNIDPSAAGYTWDIVVASIVPSPPSLQPLPPPPAMPETTITAKPPARTHDRTPTLRFRSSIAGSSYRCSIDGEPFKVCRSPYTTPPLKPGRHRVRVKAIAAGTVDPTPASCSFKVMPKAKARR